MAIDPLSAAFWSMLDQLFLEVMAPFVQKGLVEGYDEGVGMLGQAAAVGTSFDLVNAWAANKAASYSYELVHDINSTSRKMLQQEVSAWIERGDPLQDLISRLEEHYAPYRSYLIAQTETTRMFAAGNQRAWEVSGNVLGKRWVTNNDEIVCPICGDADGREVMLENPFPLNKPGKGDTIEEYTEDYPPAHVGCRCWMQPIVEIDDSEPEQTLGDLIEEPEEPVTLSGDDWETLRETFDSDEFRSWDASDTAQETLAAEFRPFMESVDSDTAHALQFYTDGGYSDMNDRLRSGTALRDYQQDAVSKLVPALTDPKVTLSENTVFWRGVSGRHADDLVEAIQNGLLKPGDKYSDLGFMSTSGTRGTAFPGLKFQIFAEKGAPGKFISYPKFTSLHEVEYLIPPGSESTILDIVSQGNGRYLVKLFLGAAK